MDNNNPNINDPNMRSNNLCTNNNGVELQNRSLNIDNEQKSKEISNIELQNNLLHITTNNLENSNLSRNSTEINNVCNNLLTKKDLKSIKNNGLFYFKIFNSISIFGIMLICLFTYLSINENLKDIGVFIQSGIIFFNNTIGIMDSYSLKLKNSLNILDNTFTNLNNKSDNFFITTENKILNSVNNLDETLYNLNNSMYNIELKISKTMNLIDYSVYELYNKSELLLKNLDPYQIQNILQNINNTVNIIRNDFSNVMINFNNSINNINRGNGINSINRNFFGGI